MQETFYSYVNLFNKVPRTQRSLTSCFETQSIEDQGFLQMKFAPSVIQTPEHDIFHFSIQKNLKDGNKIFFSMLRRM